MDRVKQSRYNPSMTPRILWPEFAAGFGVVLLRLATVKPGQLWRDWLLVLGLFGICRALGHRSDAAPIVAATTAAYLLAIQILGQLPQALSVWGVAF